jgi:TolA-binding protein
MAQHTQGMVALVVVALAIMLVVGFSLSRREAKAGEARNALFAAEKAMETELKAMAPPAPKADSKAAQKAEKPPAAETADDIENKPMDVDAKFPNTVKGFQSVIEKYSGTRAAYDAEMALGHLYLEHGQGAKAEPWFQKATEKAPSGLERPLSWVGLGYARESMGKNADAIQAFERAISYGEEGIKGDALLSIARNQEAMKDTAKAKETYDRIIRELPNTEAAKNAELFKAAL